MSFVKDDYSHTRGVGAVASMDAASPGRRLAAARSARELARRDVVMASRTLGAPIETGQESAFSRPPTPPPRPPGRPPGGKPRPPRFPRPRPFDVFGMRGRPMVKSPGSVIDTGTTPPAPTSPTTKTPTKGASKEPSRSYGGGGGGGGGGSSGGGSANVGPLEPLPDEPAVPEEPPHPAEPPKPKTSGNLLMYAAIGVGAWWLMTRK